ncbi:MAG: glycosyltransferase family 4 protein [Patescibacteria group bacterium]|nr:glycosyltransferase family 4 protein [Patescibacteria group bacterium]
MKISIITTIKRKYGGKVYERMIGDALSNNFQVEFVNTGIKNGKFKHLKTLKVLWDLFKISKKKDFELVIKDFDSSIFLNKKPVKNIAIIHHIDYSFAPFWIKFFTPFFIPFVFYNLKKFDVIVTVSKYWENYFQKKDYKNVVLIYNAFNVSEFNFSPEEIEEFKKKYNLIKKPIIYLGNCQKAKGVVESFQILKDLDANLVTSGSQQVKIPARNFELEYRDYLKLLKTSSIVITMSKFKEGWCRTAHEAMLLKTPVIGSGLGGMRELLEGGKQIICSDFSSLREKVEYLLNHPEVREKMGEDGYNFAKNFTLERFKKDWLELINKLR